MQPVAQVLYEEGKADAHGPRRIYVSEERRDSCTFVSLAAPPPTPPTALGGTVTTHQQAVATSSDAEIPPVGDVRSGVDVEERAV